MFKRLNLPEGWNLVKLGEVGKIFYGKRLSEINYDEYGESKVYGTSGVLARSHKFIDIGEALIIPRKGTINNKFYVGKDEKFWVIDTAFYLKTSINTKYLFYKLETIDFNILNEATGVPSLNKNTLKQIKILYPPLPEQRKIAEILETVDNSIEKTDKIIEKYKRIKQGLMQVLLTKGIVESDELGVMSYESENGKSYELRVRNYEARNKSDELGVMSYEAKNKSFELVALVTKLAGFEYTKFINYSIEGEIILIRALNIKNGKLNLENIYTMPKKLSSFLQRSKLLKNDLVFTYVGTLGEVALIPENNKFHLAPNVARISFKNGFYEPRFILQLFLSHFVKKQIDYLTSSTTQAALSMANIRKIKIFLPPFSEQYRIASILTQIDEVIEKEQKYKAKLERIKQGLMEDFLTGKVRVEV